LLAALILPTWTARATTDVTADLPGPDLPPTGRSLFDHLVIADGGTRFDIPFPFENLVQRLTSITGVTPKVVLIPKGRSLQRDHADFDSPRIIVAFDANTTKSSEGGDKLTPFVKDRLYLGYAEKSNQIEAISYNEAAGRFEFEVVKDYRQGGKAAVEYASRSLCTRCHHNGAPIFSPAPWPETNGSGAFDSRIADQLKAAIHADTFHGFPLKVYRDVPYAITESIKNANLRIAYQALWQAGCGAQDSGAPKCRADALSLALAMSLSPTAAFPATSPTYQEVKTYWGRYWDKYLGGGLVVPDSAVLSYDPLQQTGVFDGYVDLQPGLTPEETQRIQDMLKGSTVPKEVDPLFQLLPPLETWTMGSPLYGNHLLYGIREFFTDDDAAQLKSWAGGDAGKVVAAALKLGTDNDPAVGNAPLRRGMVLRALATRLGASAPAYPYDQATPVMPAPVIDRDAAPLLGNDPPLALMRHYCLPCHQSLPGKKAFLDAKNDAEAQAKIQVEAAEIMHRLDWEGQANSGIMLMPPKNSSQHAELATKPEHRHQIIDWVKEMH